MKRELKSLLFGSALLLGGCVVGTIEDDGRRPSSIDEGSGGSNSKGGSSNNGGSNSKGGAPQTGKGGNAQAGSGGGTGSGTGGNSESGGTGGKSSNGGAAGTQSTTPKGGASGSGGSGGGSGGSGGSGGGSSGTGGGTTSECKRLGDVPACCPATGTNKTNVDEVFELLNAYRASNGLSALAYDNKLELAVHAHCMHMDEADFFDHSSPTPGLVTPWDRAKYCGTSANGENIAAGQRTPADVMNSWRNSSGHDKNMRGNFKRVGIGEFNKKWGQLFGS